VAGQVVAGQVEDRWFTGRVTYRANEPYVAGAPGDHDAKSVPQLIARETIIRHSWPCQVIAWPSYLLVLMLAIAFLGSNGGWFGWRRAFWRLARRLR
jgi:hypothetical protein